MFDSKVLAGLIDTDGYLGEGGYDFCFANKTLSKISSNFPDHWVSSADIQSVEDLYKCTRGPNNVKLTDHIYQW
jgi:hypothetical protein